MALLMDPAFCIDILRKHLSTQDLAEVSPQRQQKDPRISQRQQKDPRISHQRQQKNPQVYNYMGQCMQKRVLGDYFKIVVFHCKL